MQYTVGQQEAIRAVWQLVADPESNVLVISGPAGTGKTEIVKVIEKEFIPQVKSIRKLTGDSSIVSELAITATTNKAVDALQEKGLSSDLKTIHSALGLRPLNGKLVASKPSAKVINTLLIIDEASYVDEQLLGFIKSKLGRNSKVVFIGDECQLAPVNEANPIVFNSDYQTVHLTEIRRQADDNPIQALSKKLRDFVKGKDMPALKVDGVHIHLIKDEELFIQKWLDTVQKERSTKLIGYTNALVNTANRIAKEDLENTTELQSGDVLICNKYLPHPIRQIKTDATVTVESVKKSTSLGYRGWAVRLTAGITVFCPEDPAYFAAVEAKAMTAAEHRVFTKEWADLRPQYACTIHKSQGSTYKNVFINLNELNQITDDNELARLLYVAVSRASDNVYFTGDL